MQKQNPNPTPEVNPEKKKQTRPINLLTRYTVSSAICLIFSFVYAAIAGIFSSYEEIIAKHNWQDATDLLARMHILTDSTFVVGVVMFGIGLLVVASNGGAFEMFVYGMRRFISLFQRDVNKIPFKTFYDYHVYKSSEPKHSFAYMLIVGGVFIALSGLFLTIYMTNR